ncbi:MAG TPA: DUF2509 family protein [Buttiauxella sp.]
MKANRQSGSSSLAFVLLLMALGLLMLHGLQQQLNQQQAGVAREVGYLKSYAGAVSALAWGRRQRWQGMEQWQCQRKDSQWRACLRVTGKGESLMAAQKLSSVDKTPVTLWRWGKLVNNRWRTAIHGWIDFCPLKEGAQCLLPE